MGIKDIIRGTITGIVLSTILNLCGIAITLKLEMLLLVPFTVALMSFNPKFGCFAYVIPVTYFLGEILETFNLFITFFNLPYREFIALIGFLHIIEGIFIIKYGTENTKEAPLFNGKKVVKGKIMKKFWPIPLVIFNASDGSLIPLYTILGYADQTHKNVREKSRQMGKVVLIYGLFVILISALVYKHIIPISFALIMLPIGHELIFFINYIPTNSVASKINL
ncbi:hypothetical protein AN642_02015 [Epulopiscium sp. SCG-B10WGA-EpuloA2]|nr:hypothetical protein AN642_02015 [Epulopiscium sp. SCG-B10WGA-EpuloA2]